jgi:hypothetical protein
MRNLILLTACALTLSLSKGGIAMESDDYEKLKPVIDRIEAGINHVCRP